MSVSLNARAKGVSYYAGRYNATPFARAFATGTRGKAPRAQSQVLGLAIAGRRGYASVRDLFRLPPW